MFQATVGNNLLLGSFLALVFVSISNILGEFGLGQALIQVGVYRRADLARLPVAGDRSAAQTARAIPAPAVPVIGRWAMEVNLILG